MKSKGTDNQTKEADDIINRRFDDYGGFKNVINKAGGSTVAMIIRECMFKYHQLQVLKHDELAKSHDKALWIHAWLAKSFDKAFWIFDILFFFEK